MNVVAGVIGLGLVLLWRALTDALWRPGAWLRLTEPPLRLTKAPKPGPASVPIDNVAWTQRLAAAWRELENGDPASVETEARALVEEAERTYWSDALETRQARVCLFEALLRGGRPAAQAEAAQLAGLLLRVEATRVQPVAVRMVEDLRRVALAASAAGDPAGAEEALVRAQQLLDEPDVDAPHPVRSAVLHQRGYVYLRTGRAGAAREAFEEALRLLDDGGPPPRWVAETCEGLAEALLAQGNAAAARSALERAIGYRERDRGADDLKTGHAHYRLGVALTRLGQHAGAALHFRECLRVEERVLGAQHREIVSTLVSLAGALEALDETEDAAQHVERALGLLERTAGPHDSALVAPLWSLSRLRYAAGNLAAAEELLERALEIEDQTLGPDDPEVARTAQMLGRLALEQGRHDRAIARLTRAADIYRRSGGPDDFRQVEPLSALVQAQIAAGALPKARRSLERVIALETRDAGDVHPEQAVRLNQLGVLLARTGDHEGSTEAYRRALTVLERYPGANHPVIEHIVGNLSAMAADSGHGELYAPLLGRARDLRQFRSGMPPIAQA